MKYTVCELFAGVGGLRLGLEKDGNWKVIWSNQWEPATKIQHAADCYRAHFPKENDNEWFNQDISTHGSSATDAIRSVRGFYGSNEHERMCHKSWVV